MFSKNEKDELQERAKESYLLSIKLIREIRDSGLEPATSIASVWFTLSELYKAVIYSRPNKREEVNEAIRNSCEKILAVLELYDDEEIRKDAQRVKENKGR
jgi:hypothetical protein